jgi:uncharacterized protein (DUF58 family)
MIPSLRLVLFVAAGSVLWLMAALSQPFAVAAILYGLVLALVAGLDLMLSPQPREFEIERHAPDKINLGASNAVALEVRSRADVPVEMTLRDETPENWNVHVAPPFAAPRAGAPQPEIKLPSLARLKLRAEPLRPARCEYSIVPTRRGEWQFGAISARYGTRLGFWMRQFRRDAPETVRVYPNVQEVRRYELLLREGRLREIGLHVARLRGGGTEFESLREYSRDDNYKDINWKASARRAKLISTQYEIERDQTVLIALDCGRMMTAMAEEKRAAGGGQGLENDQTSDPKPNTPLSKLDCAINATVLLAHVSASMGDAVGVLLFADSVLGFVPPRKGRAQHLSSRITSVLTIICWRARCAARWSSPLPT